jgi:hypothetical protein
LGTGDHTRINIETGDGEPRLNQIRRNGPAHVAKTNDTNGVCHCRVILFVDLFLGGLREYGKPEVLINKATGFQ